MADLCTKAKLLREKGDRLVKAAQAEEHRIYTASTKMGRDKAQGLRLTRQREVVQGLYKRAKEAYKEAVASWEDGRCGRGVGGSRKRKRPAKSRRRGRRA